MFGGKLQPDRRRIDEGVKRAAIRNIERDLSNSLNLDALIAEVEKRRYIPK